MANNITMYSIPYAAFIGRSGTQYQANSAGVILNVLDIDRDSLISCGATTKNNNVSIIPPDLVLASKPRARVNLGAMGDSRQYLNCTNQVYPYYYKFNNGVMNQVQSLIGERYRWGIESQSGVSGDTAQGVMNRCVADCTAVMAKRPADEEWDWTYWIDINDAIAGISFSSFATYFRTTMKSMLSLGIQNIFIISGLPYPQGYGGETAQQHATRIALIKNYNIAMKAFCDITPGLWFIDCYAAYGGGSDVSLYSTDIHPGCIDSQIIAQILANAMIAARGEFNDPGGVPISNNPSLTAVEGSFNSSTMDNWYCSGFSTGVKLTRDTDGALIVEMDATQLSTSMFFNIFNNTGTMLETLRAGDVIQGILDMEILEVIGLPAPPQFRMVSSSGGYFAYANSVTGGYGKGCLPLGRQCYMTQEFLVDTLRGGKTYQPYIDTTVIAGTKLKFKVYECGVRLISRPTRSVQSKVADYTPVLRDAEQYIRLNKASAIVATIPPSSTTPFPVGTVIMFEQTGAGAASLLAGSGVTLQKKSTLNFVGQYSVVSVRKVGTDEWVCTGDLS